MDPQNPTIITDLTRSMHHAKTELSCALPVQYLHMMFCMCLILLWDQQNLKQRKPSCELKKNAGPTIFTCIEPGKFAIKLLHVFARPSTSHFKKLRLKERRKQESIFHCPIWSMTKTFGFELRWYMVAFEVVEQVVANQFFLMIIMHGYERIINHKETLQNAVDLHVCDLKKHSCDK